MMSNNKRNITTTISTHRQTHEQLGELASKLGLTTSKLYEDGTLLPFKHIELTRKGYEGPNYHHHDRNQTLKVSFPIFLCLFDVSSEKEP
jgi:hypothetical protein